ncbi:hypothetical protein HBH61_187410 [Parastagonospora nodorum]|nr:hypothetical protein HBH50_158710 [Parastagonospora nodorum]KAH4092091.1 hypothetical protein HBH48_081770 [Parastagonospora nodorum]KAH4106757.1 hypothetical protein HBH46_070720 [Parastagonospora nodorum]KAH4174182.1 hypothetical protein HBH43_072860 [Parastagonospora nodorum]KAH4802519.1 hypothetical protein HBH61_187410 [Parastagonospora nodorum]
MLGDLRKAMKHAVRFSAQQGLTTLRCDQQQASFTVQTFLSSSNVPGPTGKLWCGVRNVG